jgi:spermidine synthase
MSRTETVSAGAAAGLSIGARRWAPLVYVLFFLSGLTSLIYEVIWTREFGLVFGVTTYAVSTVLAAFFTGLAIGSYTAGRLIDRTRAHPLFIYGAMEGAIGVYALVLPFLLKLVEASYPGVYAQVGENFTLFTLFRFVASFAVLVIPTTLMGATLPVLSKLMVDQESELGLNVGRLYSVNTFGAVAGTFLAGFVLIATFGVPRTILLAAGGNFVLALCATLMSQTAAFRASPVTVAAREMAAPERRPLSTSDRLMLVLAFTSGLSILALEVVWTKSLVLILGSTTYAFATMLTAVLVGIAAGSAVFAGSADLTRNRGALVATLLFLGGLCAVLGPAVINRLPFVFLRLWDWTHGVFGLLVMSQFAVCFLLVFIPTFLSGASFPILVRMHSRGLEKVGSTVADVYAINTLGGIFGSLLGGFVLVRFFGMDTSLTIAALILMAVGGPVAMLLARPWRPPVRTTAAGAMGVVVLVLVFVHPQFDTKLLFGGWGPFAGGNLSSSFGSTVDVTDRYMQGLVYHREGVSAAVDVVDSGYGGRLISINAQPVATTYLYDMRALKMLGHLPVLLHPHPKHALLIGMGAGVSSGIIGSYPEVEDVTVVELNEEVPDGTRHFADWNFHVIDNPKVKRIINDGANYVKATRKKYDIISSDPIHPFILGNGTLYSVDHWKICKQRLEEGGVIAQWIPMYQLSPTDWATIIRSFTSVFPNSTIWYCGIDVVLIGHNSDKVRIDLDAMARHMSDPVMAKDLLSMGAGSVGDILGWLVGGPEQLAEMGAEARLNTVDRPVLEYTAPKALVQSGVSATMPALLAALQAVPPERVRAELSALCTRPPTPTELYDAVLGRQAQQWVMRGQLLSDAGFSAHYVRAIEHGQALRSHDRFLSEALADAELSAADGARNDDDLQGAYHLYRAAMQHDPTSTRALVQAAWAAADLGSLDEGERILATASPEQRKAFMYQTLSGVFALDRMDYEAAREHFTAASKLNQEAPELHVGEGVLDLQDGRREKAYAEFARARKVDTSALDALSLIVTHCVAHNLRADARPYAEDLVAVATGMLRVEPSTPLYYDRRAQAYEVLGDQDLAARDRETAASLRGWWLPAAVPVDPSAVPVEPSA